jgi:hypothetical protein
MLNIRSVLQIKEKWKIQPKKTLYLPREKENNLKLSSGNTKKERWRVA